MNEINALLFRLPYGVTLRIGQSSAVIKFKAGSGLELFKDYIAAKAEVLDVNPLDGGTVDASKQGVPPPLWLLELIINYLNRHAAKLKDDGL